MGRQPCCDKIGLKRGPWTIEEDHKLVNFILNNGIHCWRLVPKLAGLLRCGKSCRLRWINYLRPDLKRGAFTDSEEDQIIQLHSQLGNRWSKIASHFPGRTDNEIKNHWNTRIKKKLKLQGVDPVTHKSTQQNDIENDNKINNINSDNNITTSSTTTTQEEEVENLLNNYDIMMEFDEELKQQQETNSSSSSTSTRTSTTSVNGDDELSIQQWIDNVDSFLSWDCFNQIQDDNLLFL